MNIVVKRISDLNPYKNNQRYNDKAVEHVAKSIKEFGFKVPIVVDRNNVIIAGHTRYKACELLGISDVPCIIADDLDENQARAFRIADNKVSDYSIWDNKILLEELDAIGEDVFTGFTISDIFEDIKTANDLEVLDTNDNSIIDDNKSGVSYKIEFVTQSEQLIEKIKKLIKENGDYIENV